MSRRCVSLFVRERSDTHDHALADARLAARCDPTSLVATLGAELGRQQPRAGAGKVGHARSRGQAVLGGPYEGLTSNTTASQWALCARMRCENDSYDMRTDPCCKPSMPPRPPARLEVQSHYLREYLPRRLAAHPPQDLRERVCRTLRSCRFRCSARTWRRSTADEDSTAACSLDACALRKCRRRRHGITRGTARRS